MASIAARTTSMKTARMMTRPRTMFWPAESMDSMVKPLRRTAMIRQPTMVPAMVPLPPVKEAPPMMQAAMASVS